MATYSYDPDYSCISLSQTEEATGYASQLSQQSTSLSQPVCPQSPQRIQRKKRIRNCASIAFPNEAQFHDSDSEAGEGFHNSEEDSRTGNRYSMYQSMLSQDSVGSCSNSASQLSQLSQSVDLGTRLGSLNFKTGTREDTREVYEESEDSLYNFNSFSNENLENMDENATNIHAGSGSRLVNEETIRHSPFASSYQLKRPSASIATHADEGIGMRLVANESFDHSHGGIFLDDNSLADSVGFQSKSDVAPGGCKTAKKKKKTASFPTGKLPLEERVKEIKLPAPNKNIFLADSTAPSKGSQSQTIHKTARAKSGNSGGSNKLLKVVWLKAFQERPYFAMQFEDEGQLGKGAHSTAIKARCRMDGCLYAVKRMNTKITSESSAKLAFREVFALSALQGQQCPHLVRYYNSWLQEQHLWIQTELCLPYTMEIFVSSPKTTQGPTESKSRKGQALRVTTTGLMPTRNSTAEDIAGDNENKFVEIVEPLSSGSCNSQDSDYFVREMEKRKTRQGKLNASSLSAQASLQFPSRSGTNSSNSTTFEVSYGSNNLNANISLLRTVSSSDGGLARKFSFDTCDDSQFIGIDDDPTAKFSADSMNDDANIAACNVNDGVDPSTEDTEVRYRPSEALVWLLIREVSAFLSFIHERGLAHLDIRPGNIFLALKGGLVSGEELLPAGDRWAVSEGLLSGEIEIRIGDLGSCAMLSQQFLSGMEGETRYCAMELITGGFTDCSKRTGKNSSSSSSSSRPKSNSLSTRLSPLPKADPFVTKRSDSAADIPKCQPQSLLSSVLGLNNKSSAHQSTTSVSSQTFRGRIRCDGEIEDTISTAMALRYKAPVKAEDSFPVIDSSTANASYQEETMKHSTSDGIADVSYRGAGCYRESPSSSLSSSPTMSSSTASPPKRKGPSKISKDNDDINTRETLNYSNPGFRMSSFRSREDNDSCSIDLTKADVFSLFCTVYEVCKGEPLMLTDDSDQRDCDFVEENSGINDFSGSHESGWKMSEWHELRRGIWDRRVMSLYSPQLQLLMRDMMQPNPALRPTASEIFSRATCYFETYATIEKRMGIRNDISLSEKYQKLLEKLSKEIETQEKTGKGEVVTLLSDVKSALHILTANQKV